MRSGTVCSETVRAQRLDNDTVLSTHVIWGKWPPPRYFGQNLSRNSSDGVVDEFSPVGNPMPTSSQRLSGSSVAPVRSLPRVGLGGMGKKHDLLVSPTYFRIPPVSASR